MEGRHEKETRRQIKREKEQDKVKQDRMLDRARTRDTREKNAASRPANEARTITYDPKLDRLIDRVVNKDSYKKAVRYYLDFRRKNPGKARWNAVQASKHVGADFRNFEKVFHDMIRDGKLPKHLAWDEDLLNKETTKNKIKKFFTKK